jgi:UPF0176 protein
VKFLNIAAYKFIKLTALPDLRDTLKALADENNLLGTILLSEEGINLMLTGLPENIKNFKIIIKQDTRFADLHYKESKASEQTYNKLLIKIKNEIIAFGINSIDPVHQQAAYIKPIELKQWLDENKEIIFLDTRNIYEIESGTFKQATHLNIQHFRDFPEAAKNLDANLKEKTVVTFCTGGIRCEKAALLLQHYGFKQVYQLEGGILDYFATCGNAHYEGECFVFDKRRSLAAHQTLQGDILNES